MTASLPAPRGSLDLQIVTFVHGVGPVSARDVAAFFCERDDRVRDRLAALEGAGYLARAGAPPDGFGVGWVSTGRWDPDEAPPRAAGGV